MLSMAFADLKLSAAQPAARPYHLTDGHGPFVVVQQNGSKRWRWKYSFQGEYWLMAFGSYPLVGFADARVAHAGQSSSRLAIAGSGEVHKLSGLHLASARRSFVA
jgi:hypothetical protein